MNQEVQPLVVLIRDIPKWLLEFKKLQEKDLIVLLTPVTNPVSQDNTDISDPFEPLGRSISKRHARVAHVPYVQRIGLTSTHMGFMEKSKLIIFCLIPQSNRSMQLQLTDSLFELGQDKPIIVVVFCEYLELDLELPLPTVIKARGYLPSVLEAVADLVFAENENLNQSEPVDTDSAGKILKSWTVEQMSEARDMSGIMALWEECNNSQFLINSKTLSALLRRPGYSKHYVVRNSPAGEVLGFCATYLSFIDQEPKKMHASLAAILVKPCYQGQGIGLSLHKHAIKQLRMNPDVTRLQLGSTFPRIYPGLPYSMDENEKWFQNRGWNMVDKLLGRSQDLTDLLLKFERWSNQNCCPTKNELQFRKCTHKDIPQVLKLVKKFACTHMQIGWYDQYLSLENGPNVGDVVLAIESNNIIATAITYTASCRTQVALNLPWAATIGDHVAGITCMCLADDNASKTMVEIRKGLLQFCVSEFERLGLKELFLDAIVDDVDDLLQQGFCEWSRYKYMWMK